MLYTKSLEVWNMDGGYDDDDHIHHEGTWKFCKNIMGDVQPYSGELLKREYGLEIEVTKRIFCNFGYEVTMGTILVYNDTAYEVKKIFEWDDYMELMCVDTVMLRG